MQDCKTKDTLRRMALDFQKHELTGYLVYKKLSGQAKGKNKQVLERIANYELKHYNLWKKFTKQDVSPNNWEVFHHTLLSRLFSLTFAAKLLENGEKQAKLEYKPTFEAFPKLKEIMLKEEDEELRLIRRIYEERIEYVGSIMLGIGDAVVEFTGTLAGLAFALQNTKLIGLAGLIGGIAASMSMASSEYLSKKSEKSLQNPKKAAFYTGIAYFIVVFLLVLPNFLLNNALTALSGTISAAVIVIVLFTYFVSVTQEVNFKKRLAEALLISLGIAAISFMIGIALRTFLNIDV